MTELFRSGGVIMWPMLLSLGALLATGVQSGRALRTGAASIEVRSGMDSVLFWGGFSATLGVLGTVVGLASVADAVVRAGDVHAPLLWSGVRVTLVTTIFGLLILLLSLIVWYGLRSAVSRRLT